mmetsp:Transcript_8030/g.23015  ORF Transcript_8030/g.23015 Transcript_8030/m.23015 type:complete len:641 (-) Transcript_8030:1544-3466(-)
MLGCHPGSGLELRTRPAPPVRPEKYRVLLNTEFFVALHEFLNIDLYSQGWYAIRLRFDAPPSAEAWPCRVVSKESQPRVSTSTAQTGSGGVAAGWELEESTRSFRSKVFQIRFCHEQVLLDEVVCFRLTTDFWESVEDMEVAMHVELLFQEADKVNPRIAPEPLALTLITSRQINIVSPTRSVHEYLPLVFEEGFLSCLKLSVHSVLMGFTSSVCKGSKGPPTPKEPLAPEKRDSNLEDLMAEEAEAQIQDQPGRNSVHGMSQRDLNERLGWAHLPSISKFPSHFGGMASLGRLSIPDPEISVSPAMSPVSMALKRGRLVQLSGQEVVDTVYFPPQMGTDIALQEVDSAHPLPSMLRSAPVGYEETPLGRQVHAAQDLRARAAILHGALIRPLLDSYNELVAHLNDLPFACFAPQSLETLRSVMLSGAACFNSSPGMVDGMGSMIIGSFANTAWGTPAKGKRPVRLPSLELSRVLDEHCPLLDTMSPLGQRRYSASQVGQDGVENELTAAIEAGQLLGYVGADHFLVGFNEGCTPEEVAEQLVDVLKQVRAGVLANWACLLWAAYHSTGQMAQGAENLWHQRRRAEWAPWIIEGKYHAHSMGDTRKTQVPSSNAPIFTLVYSARVCSLLAVLGLSPSHPC